MSKQFDTVTSAKSPSGKFSSPSVFIGPLGVDFGNFWKCFQNPIMDQMRGNGPYLCPPFPVLTLVAAFSAPVQVFVAHFCQKCLKFEAIKSSIPLRDGPWNLYQWKALKKLGHKCAPAFWPNSAPSSRYMRVKF